MRKNITYSFLFFFCFINFAGRGQSNSGLAARTYAFNSVLHQGIWYKIGVTGSGIYKIDKNLLQSLGLPVASLDPRNIKLYGNGGGMLPQPNHLPRPDDLVENAVWLAGEADGKFDDPDYLLFYAPGPHQWKYNTGKGRFSHETNIYTDTAYYFLTVGTTPGRRIRTQTALSGETQTITTFTDHLVYEKDLVNMLLSGREWYGEQFNQSALSRDFTFPVPGLVPNSTITLTAALMSNSPVGSSFQVKVNNQTLGTQSFNGRGSHDYHLEGENNTQTYQINQAALAGGNEIKINLTYNTSGSSDANGYLNYLTLTAERSLQLYQTQIPFRSRQNIGPGNISSFQLDNASAATMVWDVTNLVKPRALPLELINSRASFRAKTDSLREFIAFTGQDFPKPTAAGRVTNQNLHALNLNGNLDFVILTHPLFLPQAERLANHRRQHDQLEVALVTTNQVYNEFSSGAQDVTAIRDFMKMIYDRSTKKNSRNLYLLVFGDASYDYKSPVNEAKTRTPQNTNFVPVYASYQSLDPLATYSSEDYFGFLDETEGAWPENQFSDTELLDIGIGRLPVKSVAEAETIVTKIIHYDSPASLGKWRNRIALVADDGDRAEHLEDAEALASSLERTNPTLTIRKIYLDLYPQETAATGQRAATANTQLDQAMEQGALLTNYTGHGNETSLAYEQILTVPQIQKWKNLDKLTFMLLATCEFGRYDDPRRSSGAELALLSPQGGAIGMLTTTRPVFASSNRILNRNFIQNTFEPINGAMPRFGDLFKTTKNTSSNQLNNRNFALLGDPTQRLAYPALRAAVTHLNQKPIASAVPDTIRALEHITLTGIITDAKGNLANSFNGKMEVTVFEKKDIIKTLGDESTAIISNVREIENWQTIIYEGTATVKDGKYTISFVVPKDIAYQTGIGKISLYAYNNHTDAQGVYQNFVIGGSAKNIVADDLPPRIKLFMDDTTFVSGGLTNKDTYLLAQIFDENGINTTATGIDHEITAILDGDQSKAIVLNDFYVADLNKFESGKIKYLFKDLTPGLHQLTLKAWDTHNNSGEAKINFEIPDPDKIALDKVMNFPNPFSEQTTFSFTHNQAGQDIDIHIQIFNVTGKLIKAIQTNRLASKATVSDIFWDGKDDLGHIMAKGMYPYRVIVRSRHNNSLTERHQKLIILK